MLRSTPQKPPPKIRLPIENKLKDNRMRSIVLKELRNHGPFTLLGAVVSVLIMLTIRREFPNAFSTVWAAKLFEFLHPLHVMLSAMITIALYKNYRARENPSWIGLLTVILIGYFGSIGIATLSDCIIPYFGEHVLDMKHAHLHLGIVEMPVTINLAVFLGIGAAYFFRRTHFPHAGHVLLSTMASLFHILRAHDGSFRFTQGIGVIFFLFIAVWIPCCLSDIVFPLLFTSKKRE